MRGESVTMMLEPNYCLQHRDLWDLVTSRPQLYWKYEDGERRERLHIHPEKRDKLKLSFIYTSTATTSIDSAVCREYLIFSSNVSDCLSPISWKPSYWVHLTYHRISFHVLPSQRARCSIEWVNKMQHASTREEIHLCAGLSFSKCL